MSRVTDRIVKSEFDRLLKQLEANWAIKNVNSLSFLSDLRGLHKKHLALCCAVEILKGRDRKSVFLRQIPENSFLAFVFAVKGMQNPCCVQLRQMIELVLKHIYFSTHPVEYGWISTEEGLREYGFQMLIEYARRLEWAKMIAEIQVFDNLAQAFAEMSRYVHVHSPKFLSATMRRRSRQEVIDAFGVFKRLCECTYPAIALLLIVNNPAAYFASSLTEKDVIMAGLPDEKRKFLAVFLREWSLNNRRA